jgi:hypothetical protein
MPWAGLGCPQWPLGSWQESAEAPGKGYEGFLFLLMVPLTLAVSETDPYVILQLPSAPGKKFKTKTIANSSHPVWNETFSFLIQSQVKVPLSVHLQKAVLPFPRSVLGDESGLGP